MGITSIKKVFNIIQSCNNTQQLKTCETLANLYTEMVKSKGVINYPLVKEAILIKINERKQEILMANKFKGNVQLHTLKKDQFERYLIENFK